MPGSNTKALEKAKKLDCDGLIFDLEDAVSLIRKMKQGVLSENTLPKTDMLR